MDVRSTLIRVNPLKRRIALVGLVLVARLVLGCASDPSEDDIREMVAPLQSRVEEAIEAARFSELRTISDDATALYRQYGPHPTVLRFRTSLLTMLGQYSEAENMLNQNTDVLDEQLDLRLALGLLMLLNSGQADAYFQELSTELRQLPMAQKRSQMLAVEMYSAVILENERSEYLETTILRAAPWLEETRDYLVELRSESPKSMLEAGLTVLVTYPPISEW